MARACWGARACPAACGCRAPTHQQAPVPHLLDPGTPLASTTSFSRPAAQPGQPLRRTANRGGIGMAAWSTPSSRKTDCAIYSRAGERQANPAIGKLTLLRSQRTRRSSARSPQAPAPAAACGRPSAGSTGGSGDGGGGSGGGGGPVRRPVHSPYSILSYKTKPRGCEELPGPRGARPVQLACTVQQGLLACVLVASLVGALEVLMGSPCVQMKHPANHPVALAIDHTVAGIRAHFIAVAAL